MREKSKVSILKKNKSIIIENNLAFIDKIICFGLLIILLITPLLLKVNNINFVSPSITVVKILSSGEKLNIFSHAKFVFLVVSTSVLFILFLYKIFVLNFEVKPTKTNILTIIFLIIILLSSVLASYKSLALYGNYNRSEGAITYLCYSILFFIASNIKIQKKELKWFLYILSPFIVINGFMGILNFYGIDLLDVTFVKKIIYGEIMEQVEITEKSFLIGTLSNPNYLSGVSALLFFICFILAIFVEDWRLKLLNIILLYLSFGILLVSLSNSGFITILLLLPVLFVLLILKKNYKQIRIGLLLTVSLLLIYIPLSSHNVRVWNETFGNITNLVPKLENEKSLENSEESVRIKKEESSSVEIVENNFIPELPKPGSSWGSGRVFIWTTSISLIAQKPILGYGLDTFAYHFPQSNAEIISGLGKMIVIDKPHSLYLDIAFGTGIVGLLVFLLLISIPIWQALKKFLLNKDISQEVEILAITFLVLAFLIQGLVNDSIIGVSVIFYILLGVLNSVITDNQEVKLN